MPNFNHPVPPKPLLLPPPHPPLSTPPTSQSNNTFYTHNTNTNNLSNNSTTNSTKQSLNHKFFTLHPPPRIDNATNTLAQMLTDALSFVTLTSINLLPNPYFNTSLPFNSRPAYNKPSMNIFLSVHPPFYKLTKSKMIP
jgi:hypothetical protein